MKITNKTNFLTTIAILIITCLLLSIETKAETQVQDNIEADTTWTQSGSPYIVNTSITVQPGVTLTIEAGVSIKFDSGVSLNIEGTLEADASNGNSITFSSNAESASIGDWGGIRFDENAGGTLNNCVIEYADIGIYIYRSSPTISNCMIRHNNKGIRVFNSGSPQVTGCTIRDNVRGGGS